MLNSDRIELTVTRLDATAPQPPLPLERATMCVDAAAPPGVREAIQFLAEALPGRVEKLSRMSLMVRIAVLQAELDALPAA